ncbi:MAG: fasciclin domain-containing protein [Fimbriimonadia bacterium]|jgi:uncharacterized surface protein with fasciclin (FAS1) repeats
MPNIVETAANAGTFQTLVTAVQHAGLTDALSGSGPMTVFAPTDEAFAKLPAGTVEGLLQDIPKLQAILKFHVVPGRMGSAEVATAREIPTLNGQSISVDTSNGVRVNDANVVTADIEAENGIIHVIDSVILPN